MHLAWARNCVWLAEIKAEDGDVVKPDEDYNNGKYIHVITFNYFIIPIILFFFNKIEIVNSNKFYIILQIRSMIIK